MDIQIQHHSSERGGTFFIDQDGERLAAMVYRRDGNRINITHTEVSKKLEGQGIGKKLVAEGVKFVRENKLQLTATCPFAKKVLDKDPSVADIYTSAS